MGTNDNFAKQALPFTRSPLGIIGLFLILVYGLATVAYGLAEGDTIARTAIAFVLAVLPFAVLYTFFVLVTKHPMAMYAPSDYEDQDVFRELQVATMQANGGSVAMVQPNSLQKVARRLKFFRNSISDGLLGEFLWVDDKPENNKIIVDALAGLGISTAIARSTDEALRLIKTERFFAVVSDMGREQGPNEGYVLLKELRDGGYSMPFYVYAGSSKPEHTLRTIQEGGQGSTNSAMKLLEWILRDAVSNAVWL